MQLMSIEEPDPDPDPTEIQFAFCIAESRAGDGEGRVKEKPLNLITLNQSVHCIVDPCVDDGEGEGAANSESSDAAAKEGNPHFENVIEGIPVNYGTNT
eukprot:4011625-Amphidinium_carterae.1